MSKLNKNIMKRLIQVAVLFLLCSTIAQAQKRYNDYKCISGDCLNGYGTIVVKKLGKYVGYFKNGKVHGKGTFYFKNGDKYVGDYYENRREGKGKYYFANGSYYSGGWKNDKRHGQGSDYDSKGDMIQGGTYVNGYLDKKAGVWYIRDRI